VRSKKKFQITHKTACYGAVHVKVELDQMILAVHIGCKYLHASIKGRSIKETEY